jgi:hypothetical protein
MLTTLLSYVIRPMFKVNDKIENIKGKNRINKFYIKNIARDVSSFNYLIASLICLQPSYPMLLDLCLK